MPVNGIAIGAAQMLVAIDSDSIASKVRLSILIVSLCCAELEIWYECLV